MTTHSRRGPSPLCLTPMGAPLSQSTTPCPALAPRRPAGPAGLGSDFAQATRSVAPLGRVTSCRSLTRRWRSRGTRSPRELHSGASSRWRATALGCGRSNNRAGSRRRQVRPHSGSRRALFTPDSRSCACRAGAGARARAALGLAPGCPPRLRRVREHARRHPSLAADAPAVGGTARRRAARWSARLRGSRGARLRRSGTRLRGGRWSARLRGSRGARLRGAP